MKSEEKHEAESIIQAFRVLSEDEQRFAYAVLEGMKIQKAHPWCLGWAFLLEVVMCLGF